MNTIQKQINKINKQLVTINPQKPAILVAVSKNRSIDEIILAYEAGQRHFGENKLQEAQQKFKPLKLRYSDIVLHFIGYVQSRKTTAIIELCDVIHSVDREKLVDCINASCVQLRKSPELLLQVNIGNEPQKSGIHPENLIKLYHYCYINQLSISGLMCIPPKLADPHQCFHQMQVLANKLSLKKLSIGMSHDYLIAAQYGASYVRVGQGIFGERQCVV